METISTFLLTTEPWVLATTGMISAMIVFFVGVMLSFALHYLELPASSNVVFLIGIIVPIVLVIITTGYICFSLLRPLLGP